MVSPAWYRSSLRGGAFLSSISITVHETQLPVILICIKKYLEVYTQVISIVSPCEKQPKIVLTHKFICAYMRARFKIFAKEVGHFWCQELKDLPYTQAKRYSKQVSASRKKLVKSPTSLFLRKKASKLAGVMTVVIEKQGLCATLKDAVMCQYCLSGPVRFGQDETQSNGLGTNPYLTCESCKVISCLMGKSIVRQSLLISVLGGHLQYA